MKIEDYTYEEKQQALDEAWEIIQGISEAAETNKERLEEFAVIWYLSCRLKAKIIYTAPGRQQLNDILWAEISKWLESTLAKGTLKWTKTKDYKVESQESGLATVRIGRGS